MNQPAEYGISITPMWAAQQLTVGLAELADEAGLDLIGIQDHPYQWRFYDTWTLISYLARRTSQVRFFPDVVNLGLRPPAVLAKSVASLDVLTEGASRARPWRWRIRGCGGGKGRAPSLPGRSG